MRRRSLACLVTALTTLFALPALSQEEQVPFEEGVHARLQLRSLDVWVVNPTPDAHEDLKLATEVLALDGRSLMQRTDPVRMRPNDVQVMKDLSIGPLMRKQGSVLVSLRLFERGSLVWSRTYWHGTDGDSNLDVVDVPRTTIHANSVQWQAGDLNVVAVWLENKSRTPALGIKLRLVDAGGAPLEAVRYSENDLSLLPGESRRVDIYYAARPGGRTKVDIHGWNVRAGKVRVAAARSESTPYTNYYDYTYTPPARASSAEVKLPRR